MWQYSTNLKLKLLYLHTYGSEPFLRNCQFCGYSGISQQSMEPEGSSPWSQEPCTGPYPESPVRGFLLSFVTSLFVTARSCSPTPNPQAGKPPLVGCPPLLIQYIRSYPPYLEAVCCIRTLRTRHAEVTRDPPNNVTKPALLKKKKSSRSVRKDLSLSKWTNGWRDR
jgi:hypothetical protein